MVKGGYLDKYRREAEEEKAREKFRRLKQNRERCYRHKLLEKIREESKNEVGEPEPSSSTTSFPSDMDFALGYIPRYPTSRTIEYYCEDTRSRHVGVNTNYDSKVTIHISKGAMFTSAEVVENDDVIKIVIKNKEN